MTKLTSKIIAIVFAVVALFSITGVAATWIYAEGKVTNVHVHMPVTINQFKYWTGSENLSAGEQVAVQGFVDAINDETEKAVIESVVDDRMDTSRYMNEVGSMDPDANTNETYKQMLKILGLEENQNVSVVIKFIKNWFNNVTGYEVYTTTFDLSTLKQSDFNNETYVVYPVNRTTFVKNGDTYSVNSTSVVCCRAMWYYQDNNNQYDGTGGKDAIRSFDVTETRTEPPDGWQG